MAGEAVALMYLTGNRVKGTEQLLDSQTIGLLNTPKNNYRINAGWVWAADNGCFGKGYPGDDEWLSWLHSFTDDQVVMLSFRHRAPDVAGDSSRSLERSLPWLQVIKHLHIRLRGHVRRARSR